MENWYFRHFAQKNVYRIRLKLHKNISILNSSNPLVSHFCNPLIPYVIILSLDKKSTKKMLKNISPTTFIVRLIYFFLFWKYSLKCKRNGKSHNLRTLFPRLRGFTVPLQKNFDSQLINCNIRDIFLVQYVSKNTQFFGILLLLSFLKQGFF